MAEALQTISEDELRSFSDHIRRLRKVPRELFVVQRRLRSVAESAAKATDLWLLGWSPDLLMRTIRDHRRTGGCRRVLHRRWLRAVDKFGSEVNATPYKTAALNAWLRPAVCHRLDQLGAKTIADLALLMRERGRNWYRGVRGIGEVTADELWSWVASAGLLPFDETERPQLESAFGMRPLEWLKLPRGLDGSSGENRVLSHNIRHVASNDLEAVRAWLSGCRGHTLTSYTRHAEKLLLWATLDQRKAVSSLTGADMAQFFAFLSSPEPWAAWVAHKRHSRHSPLWRPFVVRGQEGKSPGIAMSQASVDLCRTVLCAMFEWLVRQRYLIANPLHELALPSPRPAPKIHDRFTTAEWNAVKALLYRLTTDEFADARLRVALLLAGDAGLAENELLGVNLGHFFEVSAPGCQRYLGLHVWGRYKSARMLLLSTEAAQAVRHFCRARQLSSTAERWPRDAPLLVSTRQSVNPITRRTLYFTTKSFFRRAACVSDAGSSESAELRRKLSLASMRWLRHTAADRMVADGKSIIDVAATLGHRSLAYTAYYFDA